MKILGYIIPKDIQENNFIKSLHKQADKRGKLSQNQMYALKDMLDIEEEFYEFPDKFPMSNDYSHWKYYYDKLIAKLKRDRFRKVQTKNSCVRALQSFVDLNPNRKLIDKALGLNYDYRRY